MAFHMAMSWHEGERKMHSLMRVPDHDNPTASMLTAQAATMLNRAPLIAAGALDTQDRPWTTLWGGEPPLSQPLGQGLIGIRVAVDRLHDPVVEALFGAKQAEKEDGEIVKAEGAGRMISALPIDLVTRKRVKIYGRMAAGAVEEGEKLDGGNGKVGPGMAQIVVRVDQSLGNCPKYLNSKIISPAESSGVVVSESPYLSADALAIVANSDLFFLSTSNAHEDMDTNHRGGPRGFVRYNQLDTGETYLTWPEYSGNRLYQTLGNLKATPRAGLVFPDFETGDVLYVSGTTDIFAGEDADTILPHSNLIVRLKVEAARHVRNSLPYRGAPGESSPYNPRVRPLRSENTALGLPEDNGSKTNSAELITIKALTPTISRYTFKLGMQLDPPWKPGAFVALDFSGELDMGYSHMRDDDPQSINDDFVRTFTISSAPISLPNDHTSQSGHAGPVNPNREFDITIRNVGKVTKFLTHQKPGFEVPVLDFGGDFHIDTAAVTDAGQLRFIAGGVGITPLLAQLATDLDPNHVQLWWAVRHEDLNLVATVLDEHPGLGPGLHLYVTAGAGERDQPKPDVIQQARDLGARCELRRLQRDDLSLSFPPSTKADGDQGRYQTSPGNGASLGAADTWYLCTSTRFRKELLAWLHEAGQKAVYEDFDF